MKPQRPIDRDDIWTLALMLVAATVNAVVTFTYTPGPISFAMTLIMVTVATIVLVTTIRRYVYHRRLRKQNRNGDGYVK